MKEYIKLFLCGLLLSVSSVYAEDTYINGITSSGLSEAFDDEDLEDLLECEIEECEESGEYEVLVDFLEDIDVDELDKEGKKFLFVFLDFISSGPKQKEQANAMIAVFFLFSIFQKAELLEKMTIYISKQYSKLAKLTKLTTSQEALYKAVKTGLKKDIISFANKVILFPVEQIEQIIPVVHKCNWIQNNRKTCGGAIVGIVTLASLYSIHKINKWCKNKKRR